MSEKTKSKASKVIKLPPAFRGKYHKIETLPVGEVVSFPLEMYSGVNNARVRFERQLGAKFSMRKKGERVMIARVA